MNAPFKNSISALVGELSEWRRDFHRHPELLYECRRTAGLVAERLREFGFEFEEEGGAFILGADQGSSGKQRQHYVNGKFSHCGFSQPPWRR